MKWISKKGAEIDTIAKSTPMKAEKRSPLVLF